tara:strand:+ start:621 stop:1178 length:558 start_codon:yes stop_codon:yes gene_type:complete
VSELHLYDFDGTLFRSPHLDGIPKWWVSDFSLSPPCVPQKPGPEWWNQKVVGEARRSIADQNVWCIMVTGRSDTVGGFRWRVPELLKGAGLRFDAVYLNDTGGATDAFKKRVITDTLRRFPQIETVHIWEDRLNHLASFCKHVQSLGRACVQHPQKDSPHPVICDPEELPGMAARVARLWSARSR